MLRGGGGSGPPATFTITGVSQTAGKAAGGTVLTVTATGISGTPTCTLGTVSAITATTFNVTTAAHAPANISWTATNGNGLVSTAQTYQYLAVPIFNSVVPSHGPATVSSSVTCGISNLPPAGTGCPITITIGAGTCTAITPTAPATCTATLSAPGAGALNCTATVDGVSTGAVAGLYTGDSPPTVTSMQAMPSAGGSVNLFGTLFISTPTVTFSNGPSVLPTPTVTYVSASKALVTLPAGSYTTGTYDVTLTNPDGQSVFAPGLFSITNVKNFATIFTTDLLADYDADHATASAGVIATQPDSSGNAQNIDAFSASKPTVTASNATFNGHQTVDTVLGSSQWLKRTTFAGVPAGGPLWFIGAVNVSPPAGTGQTIISYNTSGLVDLRSLAPSGNLQEVSNTQTTDGALTQPCMVAGGVTGSAVSTTWPKASAQVNNGTVTSATNINAAFTGPNANQSLYIASTGGASAFATMSYARLVVVKREPTTQDLADSAAYLNSLYALAPPPTLTAMTNVPPLQANGFARLSGTFNAGSKVTINGTLLTPLEVTSTVITLNTIPSLSLTGGNGGTNLYDVTITDQMGNSVTFVNACAVVAAATDPMTIPQADGFRCIAWLEGKNDTNGGTFTLRDLGFRNDFTTTGTAPTVNAPSANFNGATTLSYSGTQFLRNTALAQLTGTSIYIVAIYKMASVVGSQAIATVGVSGPYINMNAAGKPQNWWTAVLDTWGSSVGSAATYAVSRIVGSNPYTGGINVANGTEVTNSHANTVAYSISGNSYVGTRDGAVSMLNAEVAGIMIFCGTGALSGTALANLKAYANAKWGV